MLPNGTTSALVVGVGLLLVTLLAITAGTKKPDAPVGAVTRMLSVGFAYLIVIFSVFSNGGMNLLGLVLLAIALLIPIAASYWTVTAIAGPLGAPRLSPPTLRLLQLVGALAGFLIIAIQLIAAGRVISLLGGLNPAWVTAALGITVALYVLSRGWRGASRTSRWSLLFVVLAVLVFIAGIVLGKIASLGTPALPTQGYSVGVIVSVFVVVFAVGACDAVLLRSLRSSSQPVRSAIGGGALILGTVVALGLGLLLFFGGSFFAPAEPVFTVISGLGPIGLAIVSGLFVMLLASTTDTYLAATGDAIADAFAGPNGQAHDSLRSKSVIVVGVLAIVVALFAPDITALFALAAILSAAGLGVVLVHRSGNQAPPPLSLVIGVTAGLVVAVIAGLTQTLCFGPWTSLAVALSFAIAYFAAFIAKNATHPTNADEVTEESTVG